MDKHTTITSQVALWKWILLRTDTTTTTLPFHIGSGTCSYCQLYLYSGYRDCCGSCPIGNECRDTPFERFFNAIARSAGDAYGFSLGQEGELPIVVDMETAADAADEMIDYLETLIEYGA